MGGLEAMSEVDKIMHQLASVMGWMRSGKESEGIRDAMYSSAAKTCRELADRIEKLTTAKE